MTKSPLQVYVNNKMLSLVVRAEYERSDIAEFFSAVIATFITRLNHQRKHFAFFYLHISFNKLLNWLNPDTPNMRINKKKAWAFITYTKTVITISGEFLSKSIYTKQANTIRTQGTLPTYRGDLLTFSDPWRLW